MAIKKNLLKSLILSSAILSVSAQADFVRVEGGIGATYTKPSGNLLLNSTEANLKEDIGVEDKVSFYGWARVKHPIPLLPNLKVEATKISQDNTSNNVLNYQGYTYNSNSTTNLEFTEFDTALYYNILDNTVGATIDLGINLKYIQADFSIEDNSNKYSKDINAILPMAYARVRYDFPLTSIGIEAEGKYVKYGDNDFKEVTLKVDYMFDVFPVVNLGLETGYKYKKYTIEDGDNSLTADLSGLFVGLVLKF